MNKHFSIAAAILTALALPACVTKHETTQMDVMATPQTTWTAIDEAVAVVNPTEGNSAHGIVRFRQTAAGVEVTADISGLPPDSDHGFHIHEFGDASSTKGTSAGGHYNPEGAPHGGPASPHHHAGDLGNLHADASGRAVAHMTIDFVTIAGPKDPILGRSVVVHKGADDFTTQPSGNSGDRIGVGVIGIAQKPVGAPK